MTQLFKNAARSTLQSSIIAGDTSIVVAAADADLFPVATTGTSAVGTSGLDWFKAVLQDTSGNIEIIYVRTRALGVATFTNCQRGQEGTTARSYAAGSIVGLRLTSADFASAIGNVAPDTVAATGKTIPVDADLIPLVDSAASNVLAKLTWANLKATLKTYFDTLYAKIGLATGSGLTINTAKLLGRSTAATGALEEIAIGTGLTLAGGVLSGTASALSVQRRQTVTACAVGGDTATVTITNATPAVVTDTAHGFEANTPYYFPSTTGGLPTGLSLNTQYYISATGLTTNTFQLAATPGGASIATSSAGSGVHTRQSGLLGQPGQPILGGAIGGTGFTTSNINAANPLVVTAANGFNANGAVDLIAQLTANLVFTGYTSNGTWGIFVDLAGTSATAVTGNKPLPIYQPSGGFSPTADQMVFDYTRYICKVGNGAAAVAATRVCMGEVTVAGGVITNITWYVPNRNFTTAWVATLVGGGAVASLNHFLGTNEFTAEVEIECTTNDNGYVVGQRLALLNVGVSGSSVGPIALSKSKNAVGWATASGTTGPFVVPAGGGVAATLTVASWKYRAAVVGKF